MLTNEERIRIINKIEELLNKALSDDRLWDNFFIKKQIEKREKIGKQFKCNIDDCTRAMIYSFLSSQNEWDRVERKLDKLEVIFMNFNSEKILKNDPERLAQMLVGGDLKLGTQSTRKQMIALHYNIKKLKAIQQEYEYVSDFYDKIIESENGLEGYKLLVKRLAIKSRNSNDKMEQMGLPLVAEYLRNLGYDIPKPDRHILRILGPEILGEHDSANYESDKLKLEIFDIIDEYAKVTNKTRSEIDYLFWAYCANKYGEVCTKISPKCCQCAIKDYCIKYKIANSK